MFAIHSSYIRSGPLLCVISRDGVTKLGKYRRVTLKMNVSGPRLFASAIQFRSYLNHLVFGTSIREISDLDNSKPIISFPGTDSFQGIGAPPGYSQEDLLNSTSKDTFDKLTEAWLMAIEQAFPEDVRNVESGDEDEEADAQGFNPDNHPEPPVDEVKAQKE